MTRWKTFSSSTPQDKSICGQKLFVQTQEGHFIEDMALDLCFFSL